MGRHVVGPFDFVHPPSIGWSDAAKRHDEIRAYVGIGVLLDRQRRRSMFQINEHGAVARAETTGAEIDVVALAAVRATREALVARGRDKLPSLLGTPAPGETANGEAFNGETEVATFPGDLPEDPEALFDGAAAFQGLSSTVADNSDFRFLRFRPPRLERDGVGEPTLPHIRLDRALQFLIGDRLR